MKVRSGHIPVELLYIFSARKKAVVRWDDTEQAEAEMTRLEVLPAYVSDADNERTIASGKYWAEAQANEWNPTTQTAIKVAQVQTLARENTPIEGIKVVALEVRGQGGRAYKVLTPDGFYFDLREDVLLDVMQTIGIDPGGILRGQFIWAKVGAEMKLVRVGSTLYEALLEAGERALMSPVAKKELQIGTLYETKQGEKGIFLGWVDTERYSLKWPNGRSTHTNMHNRYANPVDKPQVVKTPMKRHLLWLSIPAWEKGLPQTLLNELATNSGGYHRVELKKTHSMVKEVQKLTMPANLIETVRLNALTRFQHWVIKAKIAHGSRLEESNYSYRYDVKDGACNESAMILLRETGKPAPVVNDTDFQFILDRVGQTI